jgi:hypothetical protein
MVKIKPIKRISPPTLEPGQIWRMVEANLRVIQVGKFLVHYKLGKPNAVRVANSCSSIKSVEKYLKSKKAVLAT